MTKRITLTESEKTLRQLLLDTSEYIGSQTDHEKPELRITGGWVRDKLLGKPSKDIDIGISSMTGFNFGNFMKQYLDQPLARGKYGEDILGSLAKIEANPEKSKHLETVTTKILGFEIDLVNLRKETYAEDSRNPQMEFGTPEDDALRRDSTINALFYNLTTEGVEDFSRRGLDDLEKRIIRTPLPAHQTFMDDPLRVLRCIRFGSTLNFDLTSEARCAISDDTVKAALRIKISRERIGVEVEKMLRGPNPHRALHFINQCHLYDTVFTDPNASPSGLSKETWYRVYDMLDMMLKSEPGDVVGSSDAQRTVLTLLIRNDQELYLAWLLCALTPLARVIQPMQTKNQKKPPVPATVAVAREGLKLDNKILSVVRNAEESLDHVIASKNAITLQGSAKADGLQNGKDMLSRGALGMAIRRWGASWRSNVVFALLVEVLELDVTDDVVPLVQEYATWLSMITDLGLEDADSVKPLVNGKQVQSALGKGPGPWMMEALDLAMEWQFSHPEESESEVVLEAVVAMIKARGDT